MNIFLDTSAIIAWFNTRDKYHQQAMEILQKIKTGKISFTRFIVTDYIFDEATTYFETSLKNHEAATKIGEALLSSGYIHLEPVDREIFKQAWDLFKTNTGYSFTDITCICIMEKLGSQNIFTFDNHFTRAGFNQIT